MSNDWAIAGACGEAVIGTTHLPPPGVPAQAVLLIAHGFKGYKDYGMFPRIAADCARAGFITHRFNFSHSGMTNRLETFERPDLFERDTWNRQVLDLRNVIDAITADQIAGRGLPYVIFGHSRGGVTALLTAGRYADDAAFTQPAGVITAAAPSVANSLSAQDEQRLLKQGWLESPSSRTGQALRIGREFLQEQRDDPAAHDVLAMVRRLRCPLLVVQGLSDSTVPPEHAERIASAAAARATLRMIREANHVFNTPNPLPPEAEPSEPLLELLHATLAFLRQVTERAQ